MDDGNNWNMSCLNNILKPTQPRALAHWVMDQAEVNWGNKVPDGGVLKSRGVNTHSCPV